MGMESFHPKRSKRRVNWNLVVPIFLLLLCAIFGIWLGVKVFGWFDPGFQAEKIVQQSQATSTNDQTFIEATDISFPPQVTPTHVQSTDQPTNTNVASDTMPIGTQSPNQLSST